MRYLVVPWSVLSISGIDATSFVHNLCTNDVHGLDTSDACEAFFTDVKAHVLAHALICRSGEVVSVLVTSDRASALAEHLDRYHIRENLELGHREDLAIVVMLPTSASASPAHVESHRSFLVPGLGPTARAMLVERSDLEVFLARLDQSGGVPINEGEFDAYRIELGFPLDGVDVDHRNLPQEVNRDPLTISFTKGCYLGQETVARIDALGHVNQSLMSLQVSGAAPPRPGTALRVGEEEVGRVTSSCVSADLGSPLALAYVRRGFNAPGAELEIESQIAKVLPGPVAVYGGAST